MDYQEALAYIHAAPRFSRTPGLYRMQKILSRLGNPQDKLRFIHIAGTNGKGSVTAMCANILTKAGYQTGFFQSPYIIDFRERFQINGIMISEDDFARIVTELAPFFQEMAEQDMALNEFEQVTVIGLQYFLVSGCDIVCLEVGLGGRYDSTNIVSPLVSVITAISLDHTEVLGDTIEKIAQEKAGIIKQNIPVVSYPLQETAALAELMQVAASAGSVLTVPSVGALTILENGITGSRFIYGGQEFQLSLAGIHQIYNGMTVIETMQILNRLGYHISKETIRCGLADTFLPARFEVLSHKPLTIIDGSHNPQGAEALKNVLVENACLPKVMIIGMLKDKNYEEYIRQIAPLCQMIVTVTIDNPRALTAEAVANTARPYCKKVMTANHLNEAINISFESAGADGPFLICGSLYLASEARKLLTLGNHGT